jgi:3D (Asp-Asp-Asp) domain-containing protein
VALQVAGVYGSAGLRVDDDGFREFERRMDAAERRSHDDIETNARLDVDRRGFDDYDRKVDRADKSNTRLVGSFSKAGAALRVVGTGIAAGGAAAVVGGVNVVQTATAINESLSKNEVLFGRHSKSVAAFADTSAKSLGISKAAALEATGTFGNLFVALDIGPKKAAGMSTSLTTLAADLASFNNATPEEALEAIRSGLVGETEPLRRFGVNLNDATLRTEALRMGLVKTTKEALDPQTKALAVNSLIFKQTEKAQGDFERTQGGLANQTRIFKAQISDLGANLGQRLLPAVTSAVTWVNRLFSSTDKGSSVIDRVKAKVGGFAEPFVSAFRVVGTEAGKLWDDISNTMRGVEDDLAIIGRALLAVGGFLVSIFERALPGIRKTLGGLVQMIRGVVQVIAGILTLDFGRAWDGVKNIFGGAFRAILGAIRTFTAPMREAFARVGDAIGGPLGAAWDWVRQGFKDFLDFMLGGVSTVLGAIADLVGVGSGLPFIGDKFKGLGDDIEAVQNRIDGYRESLRRTEEGHRRTGAIREQREEVRRLRERMGDLKKGTDEYRDAAEKARASQRQLNRMLNESRPATRGASRGAANLTENLKEIGITLSEVGEHVLEQTNNLLKEFGAKRINMSVRRFRSGQRGPGLSTNRGGGIIAGDDLVPSLISPGELLGLPDGSWAEVPGPRVHADNVFAMLPRGTHVYTGHGRGLLASGLPPDDAVRNQLPHFQTGGVAGGPSNPAGGVMGAGEGFVPLMQAIQRAFSRKVYVFSGLRPGSIIAGSGRLSNHSGGNAVDITHVGGEHVAGPPGMTGAMGSRMDAVERWLAQYVHPAIGLDHLWRTFTGGNHYNHIHQGINPAWGHNAERMRDFLRGVPGGGPAELARLLVRGGTDTMRTMVQGPADRVRRAGNRFLSRAGNFGGRFSGDIHGGAFASTSYGPPWGGIQGTGVTATGIDLRSGPRRHLVAVDPDVIPLGSRLRIWPNPFSYRGAFLAGDTGGAIQGNRIDFYDWRGRRAQLGWGTRNVTVEQLRRGGIAVQRFQGGGTAGGDAQRWANRGRGGAAGGSFMDSLGNLTRRGRRNRGRWGRIVEDMGRDIEGLGNEYTLKSRRFDLTEEELIDEGTEETGPSHNKEAIQRRARELRALIRIRRAMVRKYQRLVEYLTKINRLLREQEERLVRTINRLKKRLEGLGNTKEDKRAKNALRDRIEKYRGRLGDVREQLDTGIGDRAGADFERRSTGIDVDELKGELDPLSRFLGGDAGAIPLPDFGGGDTGGGDLGGDTGGDTGGGGAGPTPDQQAIIAQRDERIRALTEGLRRSELALGVFAGAGDIGAGGATGLGAVLNPMGGPGGVGAGATLPRWLTDGSTANPAGGGALGALVVLGDTRSLGAVARASNLGNSLQPARQPNRQKVGI